MLSGVLPVRPSVCLPLFPFHLFFTSLLECQLTRSMSNPCWQGRAYPTPPSLRAIPVVHVPISFERQMAPPTPLHTAGRSTNLAPPSRPPRNPARSRSRSRSRTVGDRDELIRSHTTGSFATFFLGRRRSMSNPPSPTLPTPPPNYQHAPAPRQQPLAQTQRVDDELAALRGSNLMRVGKMRQQERIAGWVVETAQKLGGLEQWRRAVAEETARGEEEAEETLAAFPPSVEEEKPLPTIPRECPHVRSSLNSTDPSNSQLLSSRRQRKKATKPRRSRKN